MFSYISIAHNIAAYIFDDMRISIQITFVFYLQMAFIAMRHGIPLFAGQQHVLARP